MDKSKAVAGGGAWMIAAALQVVPQTWPALLHPHPWGVAGFVLAGAGMFAYAAFGHKEAGGATKTQTAGDVSGKMFQAESLHYHEAPTQAVSIAPTPPTLRIPMLELSLLSIESVLLDDTYPRFGEGGEKAIVARVRNKPGAVGDITPHALNIFAQLDFDCAVGKSTVERAYWVDRDNNQITLAGGDEAWVLVGFTEHGFLSSWHNANIYPRSMREWNDLTNDPESVTIPWDDGELKGQIYVISHSSRGNTTLVHERFVFTRENGNNDFGRINLRFIK